MIWLLGGYMWLYVHRPFEVWPWLGALQIERAYMCLMLIAWLIYPGKGFSFNRMHLAIGAFLLALLGSWLTSPYAMDPGCYATVDNTFKVLVFYVVLVTTVRDEKSLRQLVLFFLAVTAIYMLHSFYELLCGRYQWRMGVSRMIGVDITYSDPNAFASTLLYTLPLLIPFWQERPRRISRWLILGYLALASYCILRTGSRAGFVGLCLWGLMYIVAHSKKKIQALVLSAIGGAIAFLALAVVMPDDVQNRFMTLIDPSRGPENAELSASGRMAGFTEGIRVWGESPLFGHGPGSFAISTGRGGQAHNLYGQVLSELGVAGAAALLMMVTFFFLNWRLAHQLATGPDDFAYQVARSIAFITILLFVMGWAGHNLFRYNWQWFAAFQVIAIHCMTMRRAEAYHYAPMPAFAGAV